MHIIKINRLRVSRPVLRQVAAALRAGQVVVFPTDTAYGLAADPANTRAVARIFAIKGRRQGKQLPLIAGSLSQVARLVRLSGCVLTLARRHWPGPLTVVAPLRLGKKSAVVGRSRRPATAAVRVPALAWARAIALEFGGPITSTSANLSGQAAIYIPGDIRRTFAHRRHQPDIFLDAGQLPRRQPSTIVRISRLGRLEILRQGGINVK